MMGFESKKGFEQTESWLKRLMKDDIFARLERYGQQGVAALSAATPRDEGQAASSWGYEIVKDSKSYSIIWTNSDVVDGTPVVVLLQHGHGTRNGGYVQGRDFINPALRPIFDQMAAELWKAVTSA